MSRKYTKIEVLNEEVFRRKAAEGTDRMDIRPGGEINKKEDILLGVLRCL